MALIQNILNEEHIEILNDYWNRNTDIVKWHDKYDNLYNLEMLYGKTSDEEYNKVLTIFNDIAKSYPQKHYLLNYGENSFTRIHPDSTEKGTYVTLFESNDLLGGETLIRDEQRCIDIVDFKVGQTLTYDGNCDHGVARVRQGNRKVFVVWY